MKIQCQSCQAKYNIADEKVVGKVVKIRCKKCSQTIVINGNERTHGDASEAFAPAQADQWTVNVADGDQRTMTVSEVTSEYRAGVIDDETYCWQEGMPDWLPLREIETLYAAVRASATDAPGRDDISLMPAQSTAPGVSPVASLFSGTEATEVAPVRAEPATQFGQVQDTSNTARRTAGRTAGADLFANAGRAEDDVTTSAAAPGTAPIQTADDKPTGQRNENSVLFSLSSLTEKREPASATTATADGSGLIDIRALSASIEASDKKDRTARVDDIMNLSGGGAFGSALSAPILTNAPVDSTLPGPNTDRGGNKNTLVFAILGGCLLLGLCIAGAIILTRPSGEARVTSGAPATSVPTTTTMGSVAAPEPAKSPDTAPSPAPTPTSSASATAQPSSAAAPVQPKPTQGPAAQPAQPALPTPPATPPKEEPKPAEKPRDLNSAVAEAAGKKPDHAPAPAAPAGGTGAFDRGAAAAALGSVDVQSCRKPDGPTGTGHVIVTFAPSGNVQSANIDQGPFPGTAVGGCIAGKYRSAHVPPFAGAPVNVGKTFTVN